VSRNVSLTLITSISEGDYTDFFSLSACSPRGKAGWQAEMQPDKKQKTF